MKFRGRKKSAKKKMKKLDIIDIGIDIAEPLYFLVRFIVRSIVKMIN